MKTTWEVGADEYVHLPGIVLIPAMTTNRKFENWGKLMAKPNTVDVVFRKKGVDAKKI